jgi:phosphonate transport system substrate-binding protein
MKHTNSFTRRGILRMAGASSVSLLAAPAVLRAQDAKVLRVGLGPQQPTQEETYRVWEPIYQRIAAAIDADLRLDVANDWAGIATALANEQIDVAQMGPWGYVLAAVKGEAKPINVMLVDGKPIYRAIIVARPDLGLESFPEDARGMSMQMLDTGSTSGWLVPTHWLRSQGIDPQNFFGRYAEGASAAAAQMATVSGQVDLATGWDTHRNTMINNGTIAADANKVVWESDPLPNEVVAVRAGMDDDVAATLQQAFATLDDETRALLPKPYTGFEPTTHEPYAVLEEMGYDLGALRQ